jgi:hypothetical protein
MKTVNEQLLKHISKIWERLNDQLTENIDEHPRSLMDIQIDDQVRRKVYDKLNQILIKQTEVQSHTNILQNMSIHHL